jgi:hypothetical protein
METIKNASLVVQTQLTQVLQNPYLMASLKVALMLYASQIAPKLPTVVQNTFANTFVKIIAIAMIAYLAEIDLQLSIILAIVFVLSTNLLSGRSVFESFGNSQGTFHADQTKYTNLLGEPAVVTKAKLIESLSDIYPGCGEVKIADLIALFDGDKIKLQDTVQYAIKELMETAKGDSKAKLSQIARAVGLPYNVQLTDENAGLISTLLLQYGYKVSDDCQVPH